MYIILIKFNSSLGKNKNNFVLRNNIYIYIYIYIAFNKI